jgi:hypothetical protein
MACGCPPSITPCSSDPCGCSVQLGTQCIFYQSDTLSCIPAYSGDSLEVILGRIDEFICNNSPSGLTTTVVASADPDKITVTSVTSGTTTTYYVDIADAYQNYINSTFVHLQNTITSGDQTNLLLIGDLDTRVTAIEDCCDTISSLALSGVIYANNAPLTRPNAATLATTKSFLANYITTYSLAVGDVIKIRSSFQLPTIKDFGSGGICKILLSSGTELAGRNDGQDNEAYSFLFDLDINVVALSESNNALITGTVHKTLGETNLTYTPNNVTSYTTQQVAHTYSFYDTIDWTTLNIQAQCTGSTVAVPAKNDLFRIELLKKI